MDKFKQQEFNDLFQEFIKSYPYSPEGVNHSSAYAKQREQGKRNFAAIATTHQEGKDITDRVLLQLLPHNDTPNNSEIGAWIHIAPAIIKDIKIWYENKGWIKKNDWQKVAYAIFDFIQKCINEPQNLPIFCAKLSNLSYIKGFQTGMLTPILNALSPDDFLLINSKSSQVINYFADTDYGQKLTDYPKLNTTGKKLIQNLSPYMQISGRPALRDDDLFDMFCHWLVAVKKYSFLSKNTGEEILEPILLKSQIYTLEDCIKDTMLNESELNRFLKAIKRKKQAIFYGSPGTGKTYIAQKLAQHLISDSLGFSELIQFHPAYTYEDFIQGIHPHTENGQISYSLLPGKFLQFCEKAAQTQDNCVLIIDEINRANLAQVFGELMYLLEYRGEKINLASGNYFSIPENVYIIGTMNTADRSIALVDHALRRRFAFIEITPNYDILKQYHPQTELNIDGLIAVLKTINKEIADKNYYLGISYFMINYLEDNIEDIWIMEIEPYLEEYFFNQLDKVDEFRWTKIKDEIIIINKSI